MTRTPPVSIRRQLRSEVGFGCPAPDCGNPYLYWHHFDPPWSERQHHNPEGMIALCGEHHAKADAGAFSADQLRHLKEGGATRSEEVRGRFDWMRRELLAVVGGNFYYRTPVIFQFRKERAIWFNRDPDGYLLLNFRMLTTSGQPCIRIEDNSWLPRGDPDDLECPPSGKLLKVSYDNGDFLRIEFFEADSIEFLQRRYPDARPSDWDLPFPITLVEVHNRVGGTTVEFGPKGTKLGGIAVTGMFAENCGAGLVMD
jgi:hypothetical protein